MYYQMTDNSDKTSIQVSTTIRDLLKEFCEDNGYKMNRFAEKAILDAISGSYRVKSYENDKTTI
jgi:hypothetical protein